MNPAMLNAYLILNATLFAIAFCGSYSAPSKPNTLIIRVILFLLGSWSVALLFAGQQP